MRAVKIASRLVGEGYPCLIVAEGGVNHNGESELAKRLVDAAQEAGADAIKFQTFKTERIITWDAPKAEYQKQTTDPDESQFEMLRRLELSREAHQELVDYCQQKKILFMSSPFDEESADFLDELGVVVFKIPSGEITNLPFLAHLARKGKPMIVSTGMSHLSEVETAIDTIKREGNDKIILLHCVSSYPTAPRDVNLRAIETMAKTFGLPVGFSDHTPGIEVALAAVALGACVIEKHLTLDRSLPGPDQRTSLEPDEMSTLVRGVRIVESSLGHGRKEPAASEANIASAARKSLVAAQDILAGTVLTEAMIAVKRPGTGLVPGMKSNLIGRTAKKSIPAGTLFTLEMIEMPPTEKDGSHLMF